MKSFPTRIIAVSLLIAAVPPSPSLFEAGLKDIASHYSNDIKLILDPEVPVSSFDGATLRVNSTVAGLVETRQEARALAALMMSYGRAPLRKSIRKAGTAEKIVAFPLAMFAEAQADGRQNGVSLPDARTGRGDPEFWQDQRRKQARSRAVLAVHLTEQAGGCTGPMVDMLTRMRSGDSTSGVASADTPAGFARMVMGDLGKLIYPPDHGCVDKG